MAQTLKILADKEKHVYIPESKALCPLAEMVSVEDLENAYNFLKNKKNLDVVIVTYVNSYIDVKAFTGKTHGSCCTSSNAQKIIKYFLSQNKKIIFVPDFYLGSNTALKIGNLKVKSLFENNRLLLDEKENYDNVDIFLWNGFCPVHQIYAEEDIINFRKNYPGIKIVVHPESKIEVVKLSDFSGSTEFIYNLIKNSDRDSIWAVGTESTFVNRLKKENPDKVIFSLKESYCKNMQKTNLENLYNLLLALNNNSADAYEIKIDEIDKENSLKSLDMMIKIVDDKV